MYKHSCSSLGTLSQHLSVQEEFDFSILFDYDYLNPIEERRQ